MRRLSNFDLWNDIYYHFQQFHLTLKNLTVIIFPQINSVSLYFFFFCHFSSQVNIWQFRSIYTKSEKLSSCIWEVLEKKQHKPLQVTGTRKLSKDSIRLKKSRISDESEVYIGQKIHFLNRVRNWNAINLNS